ncbi:type 2 isopentenyl-diphosphate Delta-isomerase [Bacillus sp. FJAT-47783]|uniref:type 2 isopentenyl-diphosphate Delta-isomerase n=1 Tax=Bacillus sp. FJAT-47783 TaxID=2922712 RepID=UPI001FAE2318|nr:type 2 isopentenyl-diphosphate Delta-isomerase [Bacillus sp. FJAT-47783]
MDRAQRKIDHINYAIQTRKNGGNGLSDIRFVHNSLPDMAVSDVDLSVRMGELFLSSPIFINAMTGGGGSETLKINEGLALVAKELNMAMAVGSQMAAIKDRNELKSFEIVRKIHQKGMVFANLGSEATVEQAKQAVEMIEANALQIHLNAVQELVMPEGDRDFTNALKRIERIVNEIEVPVIVKEVGYGMSRKTALKLYEAGVSIVDVGGYGGTNFSKVENERRMRHLAFFEDWGIETSATIAEVASINQPLSIIATGGINHALDVAKAIALGASSVGMAGYVLTLLRQKGVEKLLDKMKEFHEDLSLIMTALGVKSISALQRVPLVIKGDTYHWLKERNVDTTRYANRN